MKDLRWSGCLEVGRVEQTDLEREVEVVIEVGKVEIDLVEAAAVAVAVADDVVEVEADLEMVVGLPYYSVLPYFVFVSQLPSAALPP